MDAEQQDKATDIWIDEIVRVLAERCEWVHPEQRREVAAEFLDFLGKLTELFNSVAPSAARFAALTMFAGSLSQGIEQLDPRHLQVAAALITATDRVMAAAHRRAEVAQ